MGTLALEKSRRLIGLVSIKYLTDLIWNTPFFIYGLVVRCPHRFTFESNISNKTATVVDWFPVDIFPSHVSAAPCLVRSIFTFPYPPGHHGLCSAMVPSARSHAAACTSRNRRSLGTRGNDFHPSYVLIRGTVTLTTHNRDSPDS